MMARPAAEAGQVPGGEIPGNVQRALQDVNVPSYVVDRFGIIRWINPATERLVGDVRGRQQSSVVAPEQRREAKESFTRKLLGTEKSTEEKVVVLGPDGERIQVEISAVPLYDGGRIVGVFGLVPQRESTAPPRPHPHGVRPAGPALRLRSRHARQPYVLPRHGLWRRPDLLQGHQPNLPG